jgi:tetratricopeptide (TPR) repeat protein
MCGRGSSDKLRSQIACTVAGRPAGGPAAHFSAYAEGFMQSLRGLILIMVAAFAVVPAPGALSPAQQRLQAAENAIKSNPDRYQAYNDLAFSLVSRARETSDASYYNQAAEALQKSLRLTPDNFEALKAQVEVLLGQRRWAEARERARVLNRRMPDDVPVYGYISEAAFELGDYDEAEESAQWMLDLRPSNTLGLVRGAELRAVYGDSRGALDFYNQVYQEISPHEVEQIARVLAHMADLELGRGHTESAERLLGQALKEFPGYYLALEALARLRTAQGKYAEAVALWRQRTQQSPNPQSLYGLAETLERGGLGEQARTAYTGFEQQARQLLDEPENANRELILFYAGYAHDPAEALRVAKLEVARRHDVFTLDAYAWALAANSQWGEAKVQMEKALRVGVRDAAFFYHAGVIASNLNDRSAAQGYFKGSLDLNPVSTVSAAARQQLEVRESRNRPAQGQ